MHDLLPPGGLVRKLWPGEAEAYRDHLLRLDPESRRRRFSGAVGDDFIAQHARSIGMPGASVFRAISGLRLGLPTVFCMMFTELVGLVNGLVKLGTLTEIGAA